MIRMEEKYVRVEAGVNVMVANQWWGWGVRAVRDSHFEKEN